MKYKTTVFLCAVMISSGVLARGTRTVAFSAGAAASVSAHLQTTEPYRVRCRGIAVFAR